MTKSISQSDSDVRSRRWVKPLGLVAWTAANFSVAVVGAWLYATAPAVPARAVKPPVAITAHPSSAVAPHSPAERPAIVVSAGVAAGKSRSLGDYLAKQRASAGNPDEEFLRRTNLQRDVVRNYGWLLDVMPQLTHNERAELLELLRERSAVARDTRLVLAEQGIQPGTPAYQQAIAGARADSANKIRQLCGSKYPDVMEKMEVAVEMIVVEQGIGHEMNLAGHPLTPEQKFKLATSMHELGFMANPEGEAEHLTEGQFPAYDAVISHAARYLLPTQVAVLQNTRSDTIASRLHNRYGSRGTLANNP